MTELKQWAVWAPCRSWVTVNSDVWFLILRPSNVMDFRGTLDNIVLASTTTAASHRAHAIIGARPPTATRGMSNLYDIAAS